MANSSNSSDSGADSIVGTRNGWNKQVGSTDTSVADTFTGDFRIGGTTRWSEDITGYMSDVAVWDERLSVEQVQGLADGSLTPLSVPEPASLSMLGLFGLALFLRRRLRG